MTPKTLIGRIVISIAALALSSAANLCAYSGGGGSSDNPYILDASNNELSYGIERLPKITQN